MALKRVALHWGDSVAFCFVPKELPATLKAYDDGENERQKSFFITKTNQHGFPLCIDDNYLRLPNLPYGDHLIGLDVMGTKRGSFKFEACKKETNSGNINAVDDTINVLLAVLNKSEDLTKLSLAEKISKVSSILGAGSVKNELESRLNELVSEHSR